MHDTNERRFESFAAVADVPKVFIERDYAGMGGYLRYTVYPDIEHQLEGSTLLQHPYYQYEGKLKLWKERRDAFFANFAPDTMILTPSRTYVGRISDIVGFDGYER